MIVANSLYQYNKWQAWKRGEIRNADMNILARTYINQIHGLCFNIGKRVEQLTDNEAFTMVADNIQPPKQ